MKQKKTDFVHFFLLDGMNSIFTF